MRPCKACPSSINLTHMSLIQFLIYPRQTRWGDGQMRHSRRLCDGVYSEKAQYTVGDISQSVSAARNKNGSST